MRSSLSLLRGSLHAAARAAALGAALLSGTAACRGRAPEPAAPSQDGSASAPRPSRFANLSLPQVAPEGLAPLENALAIVVQPSAITIEGQAVVALTAGEVDPSDKEGGAQGSNIPRLTHVLAALRTASPRPLAPPLLLCDRTLPARLLIDILVSARKAGDGFHRFQLAAEAGAEVRQLQLGLAVPPLAPPETGAAAYPDLIVALAPDRAAVWSRAGLARQPPTPRTELDYARPTAAAELGRELAKRRGPADREVLILVSPTATIGDLARLAGAIRATGGPEPLEIRLSAGHAVE